MKKLLVLTLLTVSALGGIVFAADFPITASIPKATTVLYAVSEIKPAVAADAGAGIPGSPEVWTSHPSFGLNFVTAGEGMKYNNKTGVWGGSRYFAIDLSPADAVGNPSPGVYGSITFSYSQLPSDVPTGQAATEGLNKRGTLTAVKASLLADGKPAPEVKLQSGALGNTFTALNNTHVAGGWLRVYVGLATGEKDSGGALIVPGSVPFTNADKPGTYKGTLTITATLI